MTRLFAIILSLALFGAAQAKPPTPTVKRPVATGTRGAHPAKIGGPAKRTGTIGGPAPHAP
jgi:hypothetical protein